MTLVYQDKHYTAEEFLKLETSELWLVDVQKVLFFLLSEEDYMEVATSGSTGKPKVVAHPRKRLTASAWATLEYFDLEPGQKAFLALPAKYIAGIMMIVRAFLGRLELHLHEPELQPVLDGIYDFIPLTPAQYSAMLKGENAGYLTRSTVLLGGSEVPMSLEKDSKGTVFVGYGMTETASHVALRKLGTTLYEAVGNTSFEQDKNGCLVVNAPHLGLNRLVTTDQVYLINERSFNYVGRADFIINSGGVKVQPEPMERKLQEFDVDGRISQVTDHIFGQLPVLVLVADLVPFGAIEQAMEAFPKIWRPKDYLLVSHWPLNKNGKLDRAQLAMWVTKEKDRLSPL